MPIHVNVKGLDTLLDSKEINPKRIKAAIKEDIGKVAIHLHSTLHTAVFNKFSANNDINSRLMGGSASIKTFGSNIIKAGLEYSIKYADMSKFDPDAYWGNIKSPAKNQGLVHTAKPIRNGSRRIVYGKKGATSGRGGFMPRRGQRLADRSIGTPKRYAHGHQMFMRRNDTDKNNLILLLGPSTATMIYWALNNDTNVKNEIATIETRILKDYF